MPLRSANVSDEVYQSIQDEMKATGKSYSFIVNRRLEEQIKTEKTNPK
jgi:hypothetical protein